jgi:toxin CcdB
MAQFRVYKNPQQASKVRFPLLLDVQNDLIAPLDTRVVVPLSPAAAAEGRQLTTLMPSFEIEGSQYSMCTPQLAGVPKSQIGAQVADLAAQRDQIIAALDLLITGI